MNYKIFIMCGGAGERLNRGMVGYDLPKAMFKLPIYKSEKKETVLTRLLIQLLKNKIKREDIVLCTGYKEDIIIEHFSQYNHITTYNNNEPCGILGGILKVLMSDSELGKWVFILGDTVWSITAIEHFLDIVNNPMDKLKSSSPIIFYRDHNIRYTETYAIIITSILGLEIVLDIFNLEFFPVIKGEIATEGKVIIPFNEARLGHLEKAIDSKSYWNLFKSRINKEGQVDDFDWPHEYETICNQIIEGGYKNYVR